MSAVACDVQHPERAEVRCDKPSPCSGYHANAKTHMLWGAQEVPVAPASLTARRRHRGPGRGGIAVIASRVQR